MLDQRSSGIICMFGFGKTKPKRQVVTDFEKACTKLISMGVDINPRKSAEHVGRSVIVRKGDLDWVFAGDTEVFSLGRRIKAPDDFDIGKFVSWLHRKNFVNVVYDPPSKHFIMVTNIVVEGGVVVENLARLVHNYDKTITSFMQEMNLGRQNLAALV